MAVATTGWAAAVPGCAGASVPVKAATILGVTVTFPPGRSAKATMTSSLFRPIGGLLITGIMGGKPCTR